VSNNLAEGFERGSTAELIAFLSCARGSAGEVRSMLHLMERVAAFADLGSEISDLESKAESISRQIRGGADSLRNSEIKDPRHLKEAAWATWDQRERAKAFQSRLRENREASAAGADAHGEQPLHRHLTTLRMSE
jgi:hypothetical protein